MFNNNNLVLYNKYFQDYLKARDSILNEYQVKASKIIKATKNYEILYYKFKDSVPKGGNYREKFKKFLIVPSIFNSPEILFINNGKNLVDHLTEYGNVYLINWLEVCDANFNFSDYVLELNKACWHIYYSDPVGFELNLIGHCVGGNLALAAAVMNQNITGSLALLTTPLDFSYMQSTIQMHNHCDLDELIKEEAFVPHIYVQILFFLLHQDSFSKKIEKYFSLETDADKLLFFRIEKWLMSGKNLTTTAYLEFTQEIVTKNLLLNNQWVISKTLIDLDVINKPILQVMATSDKIVHRSAIFDLSKNCKKNTLIELSGGHISYLISSQIDSLVQDYVKWLNLNG